MTYDKEGDLELLPLVVLYNANSLANLVALSNVCDNYRVTMDSKMDNAIYVHLS